MTTTDGVGVEGEGGVAEGAATEVEEAVVVVEGATPCRAPGPGLASQVSGVEVAGGEGEGGEERRMMGCVASLSDVDTRCIKTVLVTSKFYTEE